MRVGKRSSGQIMEDLDLGPEKIGLEHCVNRETF